MIAVPNKTAKGMTIKIKPYTWVLDQHAKCGIKFTSFIKMLHTSNSPTSFTEDRKVIESTCRRIEL